MRRDALCVVLGLLLGAAPLAVGQGAEEEEQLAERLRALQNALHKALHRMPAAAGVPAVDPRGYQLSVIPMSDLTYGYVDFIRPQHRLGGHKESEFPLFGGQAEEAPQPYGTIEEVMELVRGSVWPQEWESGGTITAQGRKLIVFHKPAMVGGVTTFLEKDLRARSHRSVLVQAEVVSVPMGFYRGLSGLKDSVLPSAKRFALDEMIKSKAAKVLFRGRVTGLATQRVVLWHGRQVAVLADTDVEVAEESKTADPNVDAVQAGGYIWVRPHIGGKSERLRLDIEVRFDELKEPIETRVTKQNGTLDMPEVETIEARTTISIPVRTWALVGNALAGKDTMRLVLVRGEVLERGGAK